MTRRAAALCVLVALAGASLAVGVGGVRLRGAEKAARNAQLQYEQARRDAERVLSLRATAQTVGSGEQPQQDLFQRINAVLKSEGLESARVHSVSPGGARAVGAGADDERGRRVQTIRAVLGPITLAEVGEFLDRWRRDQALWVVTGVELNASTRGGAPGTYRATLTVSAMYIPTE